MKRILIVFGILGMVLAVPGVATAKFPPFTIEVSPAVPVKGDTTTITVRFWIDADHTRRSDWPDERSLDRFLWVRGGASASRIPVDLERVRPGIYRGDVTLPVAGTWRVCALSCGSRGLDLPGYARPVEILVAPTPAPRPGSGAPRAPAGGSPASWSASRWTWAILALAIPGVWTLVTAARRRPPHARARVSSRVR